MRNGVSSKKKFIYRVLQFLFGILLGHACFTLYNVIICDKIEFDTQHRDITSGDHASINSTSNFYRDLPLPGLETGTEFLDNDGMDDPEQKTKATTGRKNMVDAIYSGNFTTLANKNDLLLVGVLTSNKFLKSRACTVFNTWAKHIHVSVFFFLHFIFSLIRMGLLY